MAACRNEYEWRFPHVLIFACFILACFLVSIVFLFPLFSRLHCFVVSSFHCFLVSMVFSFPLFCRFHGFLVSMVFSFPMVFSSPLFFVSIGFHCNIFSRQIQFLFCMFTWRSRHRMQRLQLMQRNVAARPHAQSTDRCDNAIQCVCCVVRVNMQKCADTLWYASSARRELAAGTPACTPAPNQTNSCF